ncbi:uncharacterized protein [Miscanthus floridulus]|uniref:uncharacterized protein n=1 Tax=Miscanthus floridulus TaxID=154761 RepID=UPI003458B5E0
MKTLIPVTLAATDDDNSRQWRSFFDLTFKKFNLVSHVDGSVAVAAMLNDPEWLHRLTPAYSGLYSTVSKEIWSDVYKPNAFAYAAWMAITGQFLDNSLQRAIYAQQEFHNLFQGDMVIGEYCGRLKRLANTLYDCGTVVSDPTLIINTLRGLRKVGGGVMVESTPMA